MIDKSAKFWNKMAKRYSKLPIKDENDYQKKLVITRKYFRHDMHIMEFACGTGSTAILHASYVKHIQAIDVAQNMIDIAREKRIEKNINNITFECCSIDTKQWADNSFDVVLGLNVLHLLEKKEEVLSSVYKMLKPEGVFITSTVCIADAIKFLKYIAPIGVFFGIMPPVDIFTTKELLASLKTAEFEIDYQWQPGKNKAIFIVAKKWA